jgi:hypothetical protein
MSKDLVLKGSYKGVKELKRYDIMTCMISCIGKKCYQPKKDMIYMQNKITINKKGDTFYIYHMYDSYEDTYSGRWYDTKFDLIKALNPKNKSIVTKKLFEDEETLKTYNVKVTIYFNESGWDKLMKYINM